MLETGFRNYFLKLVLNLVWGISELKIEIGKMGEGPKKMEDVSHPKIMPHAAVKNPCFNYAHSPFHSGVGSKE